MHRMRLHGYTPDVLIFLLHNITVSDYHLSIYIWGIEGLTCTIKIKMYIYFSFPSAITARQPLHSS